MFLLLEATAARRWVDMTFGLLEGWWRFDDVDLRTRHPLLSVDGWLALLRGAGFDADAVGGGPRADESVFEQHLIVARAPAASVEHRPVSSRAVWWVLADTEGVGDALAGHHRARGGQALVVRAGREWAEDGPHELTVRPASRHDLDRAVEHARRVGLGVPEKIVYCWPLDAPGPESPPEAVQPVTCRGLLDLVHALEAARLSAPVRVHVVTRGAQHVGAAPRSVALGQAPLLGFGRSLALEAPELWGGTIDLDPNDDGARGALCVAAELDHGDGEDESAWRGGARFVPRLEQVAAPERVAFELDPDAAYLVTGGLGGLGLKVARWLADAGARHVVLVSRTPLPSGSASDLGDAEAQRRLAGVRALEERGIRVEVAAGDIADASFVSNVLDRLAEAGTILKGIVHAAADIGFRSIRDMDAEALAATLRPKVHGGWVLHELTRDRDLDFLVFFSSSTSLLGSHGLAHYAAANAFLDALARYRRAAGLPALSVNWGTWDEMRILDTAMRRRAESQGLRPMNSDLALDALGRLVRAGVTQQLVADIDWSRVAAVRSGGRKLLDRIVRGEPQVQASKDEPAALRLLDELRRLPPDERLGRMTAWVEGEVRDLLRVPASESIDRTLGLFQIGMDSLMAVQLRERFERALERAFPATLAFNHSTIDALARFLVEVTLGEDAAPTSPAREDVGADADELAIDTLSNEEARRLLEQELDELSMGEYE